MSKSVNVNHLHVLHLVCFNSSHFSPTPPTFSKSYRVCVYFCAAQVLMWLRKRGWTAHLSEMDLVGQFPLELCAHLIMKVFILNTISPTIISYISLTEDSE